MSLDIAATKPHERLAEALAEDLARVNAMIRARMASEHAPRIQVQEPLARVLPERPQPEAPDRPRRDSLRAAAKDESCRPKTRRR